LDEVYKHALQDLKLRRDTGCLSMSDYEIIANTSRIEDVLKTLNDAVLRQTKTHPNIEQWLCSTRGPLLRRLEVFGAAIDILAQSSPQILGVSLVGLTWGSLKFLIIVSQ
jgi:hypothetical protein